MQFMIDVTNDPAAQLRAIAALLVEAANAKDEQQPPTGDDPASVFGGANRLPEPFAPPPPPPAPPAPPADVPQVTHSTPPPPPPPPSMAPAPAGLPAGELDAAGVAYDPNIHSSSRAKMKNGLWKKRRGGPITNPGAPPPPADPPRLPSSASTPGNDQVGASVAATPPPPPPPPAAPPAPPAAPTTTGPTFRSVMAKISDAQKSGKLSAERIAQLVQSIGVPELVMLNAMPGKIPDMDALIDAELVGK